ncbi:MAG: aminotransferase class V-fold PLP-dependent enzyme [Candidatus Eremiobacteraeota bacterium]|nr:aminotransferase class V-fold PLP-dependent enzyme [Candidatus Eremiobacteraeota bacterium]
MKGRHRRHFLLDPDIGHLNHGSYGATPLPVLRAQWDWQRQMETRTVEFHVRRQDALLRQARAPIAEYLGADLDNTAFVVNTTTAMNWVAHGLPLGPGDQVLLNDHEYGAVFRCWRVFAAERGFEVVSAPLALGENLIECLERHVNPRTRAVVVSHITSATAQLLPVAEVGAWARQKGIWSIVDGAHAPGHIELDLEHLGVDFYMGNLHKWLWAPKGAALLWVAPDCQKWIKPLVVSWGVDPIHPIEEPAWVAWVQMQATRDPSSFLAAPAGLEYQLRYHQPLAESHCYRRMGRLTRQMQELGAQPLPWGHLKMRAFEWPFPQDPLALHRTLFEKHRVELPVYRWGEKLLVRFCLQHYVDDAELDRALQGLSESRVAARFL